MSMSLSFALYPGQGEAIEEGTRVSGRHLRDLAETLGAKLRGAAEVVDQLLADKWEIQMGRFGLMITHPEVHTEAEARRRLNALGIDPLAFQFEQWEEVGL